MLGLPLVRTPSMAAPIAVGVVWLGAAWTAGSLGLFQTDPGGPPVALGLAAALPVIGVALLLWLSPAFRAWAASLDLVLLTQLQAWRVGALAFLAFYAHGLLPGGFALPAGFGDLAIALTAPFVAAHIARRGRAAHRLLLGWTIFGMADLVLAVTLGVLHAEGSWGLLVSGEPTTGLVPLMPLSLIPTFGVPLMMILHMLSLVRMRSSQAGSGE